MGEQHRRTMDEHLQAALALVAPLQHTAQVSTRDLNDHHGIVVARDVVSAAAIPPFTNSAMDGFLVRSTDLAGDGPWTFPVSGDIPAGSPPVPVPAGHAVRIMTGAPVPEDPDTKGDELYVIPIENTDARNDVMPTTVTVKDYNPHRAHIRYRGEHVQPGDVVTHAGTRIDAGVIATLISAGVEQVELYPRPTVCVITSGDEVGDARNAWGIPNSNSPMLVAAAHASGAVPTHRHVRDDAAAVYAAIDTAASEFDLVVTVGGVSAGAYDVVRAVGGTADMWFGPVDIQPGKPQGLGTWNGTPVMCLPGNPVAAYVSFFLFVVPVLHTLAGMPAPHSVWDRPHVSAFVSDDFPQPGPRTRFIPVQLTWGEHGATATLPHGGTGSHMVATLAGVHGLAVLPAESEPHDPTSVAVLFV
jgi:molybdopterin biosynthesis protein moeA